MKYNLEQYIDDVVADAQAEINNIISAYNAEITDGYNLSTIDAFIYRSDNPSRQSLKAFFFYEEFSQATNEANAYNFNLPFQIKVGIGYLNNIAASHSAKLKVLLRYREVLLQFLKYEFDRAKKRGYGTPELISFETLTDDETENKIMKVVATIELRIGN